MRAALRRARHRSASGMPQSGSSGWAARNDKDDPRHSCKGTPDRPHYSWLVRFLAALLVVIAVSGCGGSSHKLVFSTNGKAVLRDAFDNQRLDQNWSCGSLRAAVKRLPMDTSEQRPIATLIDNTTGSTCVRSLKDVRRGWSQAKVRLLFGGPDRVGHCWLFKWPPNDAVSSVDGVRLCFDHARVSRIQIAVHL